MQSRKGSGKARDRILRDAIAVLRIALDVLIRADDDLIDLGLKALDDPFDKGSSLQILQAFVDATHAPTLAARENESGDFRHGALRSFRGLAGLHEPRTTGEEKIPTIHRATEHRDAHALRDIPTHLGEA
jgi:hypothetical protein